MNRELCRLDDGKATLRILYMLYIGAGLASRGELEEVLGRSGVGRTAFYSSLDILGELGLIVRERERVDGKNLVRTKLTEKGIEIAEATMEYYKVIEQEFPELWRVNSSLNGLLVLL